MKEQELGTGASTMRKPAEKIFIASIHWNNEEVLRSHWVPAIVALVKHLGPENVYVSVQESGSWDDSKGALRWLDDELAAIQVRRKILLDETTHTDEINKPPVSTGWINTPRGKLELRRIPYLSRLRNLVLQPMHELHEAGEQFDKVLFLNDVVFTTNDILSLMNTRGGEYAAACALDFAKPPKFYDTFALRDSEGNDVLMTTWPYFRSRASRSAVKASKPVPVKSCWNGIAVMDAAPFYNTTQPLSFRGVPDSLAELHLEGSECCLVHAENPLSRSEGVWLNTNVRVGYSGSAYNAVNSAAGDSWVSVRAILWGSWENRLLRWFTTSFFKERIVSRRVSWWEAKNQGHSEIGRFCLINEMQILVWNGWAHV